MEITDTTTRPPASPEFLAALEIELSRELGYGAILSEIDEDDLDFVAETMTPAEAATWLAIDVEEPPVRHPAASHTLACWAAGVRPGCGC